MDRTNVEFIRAKLSMSVEKIISQEAGPSSTNHEFEYKFKIQFDKDEAQEPKTNMDEIMYYHTIPAIVDKLMILDEVCEVLVTGKNELPLWIKLSYVEGDKIFILKISKRFRKRKVVEEWHGTSALLPVIIDRT